MLFQVRSIRSTIKSHANSIAYWPVRFHFYSDEGTEPTHIHVRTSDGECKYWLEPVSLTSNRGLKSHNVRKIEKLVHENLDFLEEKYDELCDS